MSAREDEQAGRPDKEGAGAEGADSATPAADECHCDFTIDVSNGSVMLSAHRLPEREVSLPTVSGLSASSANTAGGTELTITGSGFESVTGVRFGRVPATVFLVLSLTTILVVVPRQAAATVHVTVTNRAGTSLTSSADEFTYADVGERGLDRVSSLPRWHRGPSRSSRIRGGRPPASRGPQWSALPLISGAAGG